MHVQGCELSKLIYQNPLFLLALYLIPYIYMYIIRDALCTFILKYALCS